MTRFNHVCHTVRRLHALLAIILPAQAQERPPASPTPPPTPAAQTVVELEGRKLAQWANDLTHADASVRERAIRVLPLFGAAAGTKEIVSKLIHRCDPYTETDASPRVRAVMALTVLNASQTEIPDIVAALAKSTRDPQSTIRYYAVLGLRRYGEESRAAIPQLVESAKETIAWEIRRAALNALAEAGRGATKDDPPDSRAVRALLAAKSDAVSEVRLEVVTGLGMLGPTNDPNLAAEVLATLRTMAADRDKRIAIWAMTSQMALDKVNDTTIGIIANHLGSTNEYPVRVHALHALALLGPKAKVAVRPVLELLHDKDPSIASGALATLLRLEDKSPGVLKTMANVTKNKDMDWRLRHLTYAAMEQLEKDSIKGLEKPELPRQEAPRGELRPVVAPEIEGRGLSLWLNDLRNTDPSVKERAIAILPSFGRDAGNADVITLLLGRLLDAKEDSGVRIRAASALSMLHIPDADVTRVVNGLAHAAQETQAMLKYTAVLGLGRFGQKSHSALTALAAASSDAATWEIRRAALSVLAHAGKNSQGKPEDKAYSAVLFKTKDPTAEVRLEAAIALGTLGRSPDMMQQQRATLALRNLANDQDKRVAIWAMISQVSLQEINPRTMKPFDLDFVALRISEFLKPTYEVQVRLQAIRALALLGEKPARLASDRLVAALHDKEGSVVLAAMMTLVAARDKSAVGTLQLMSKDRDLSEGLRKMAEKASEAILKPPPPLPKR